MLPQLKATTGNLHQRQLFVSDFIYFINLLERIILVLDDGKKIAETKKEYATFFFVGKDAMKASTYAKS